ncbi:DUF6123 family protein [Halobacillus mangrovi]|uniref:Uncharacterized protein n=1 Tax=Halobacillus mangrovi TaxID=402384 RepID=A0A1W5ZVL0_9BACI|nr:DUF6123 family protein [Halobacillus mangrovi]ARI77303.1 hypothetical protein HM131_10815 [Halobacillus mangrovi]
MKNNHALAYFLEDLWSKGFKLSDEDVRFIYFGKNSTNAAQWKAIIAVKVTLKFQHKFDPSFFISVLEHIAKPEVKTKGEAYRSLEKRGFYSKRPLHK